MSLSICDRCGGHIPLGPEATNVCEQCGFGVVNVAATGHVYELRVEYDDHYHQLGIFKSLEDAIAKCKAFDGVDGEPVSENGGDGETIYVVRIEVGQILSDGHYGKRIVTINRNWMENSNGSRVWSSEVTYKDGEGRHG